MKLTGKVSHFGGPDDSGMSSTEGLAFIYSVDEAPRLFLPGSVEALGHNLDPAKFYLACRWDYDAPEQTREMLLTHFALVYAPKTGKAFPAKPADWGPGEQTGRACDVSPGLLEALGIITDDVVEVIFPILFERRPRSSKQTG